jgi:hypothetical protein
MLSKAIKYIYFSVICALLSLGVRWTRSRGRVVKYVLDRGGQPDAYMTRHVLFGHMTGDSPSLLERWLPAVYLNNIHRPDHDESFHNHPWPWAITIGLLGGYREERMSWREASMHVVDMGARLAPFVYLLRRKHWHRINQTYATNRTGVWTLFVAAPRVFSQPWGYLVDGRGYVDQRERHAEIGAREVRL